ncbi:hypothetical protein AAZX31_13G267600 [Glycine max]|uniref:Uncharacterized protein n=1 Tax=Glycine max TaxID=3847 RepID=K7M2G1_SOYBN|nr:uncharacterized protein LOC100779229 [Glycine max]KAG4960870.1 hypothetical protein JHK87_037503 [Glycine soja]KAH1103854.1 hypothetical protein GYH30_037660 [Glycine max]KAH1218522.1 hypothetical protein GmHk_13G038871 [Glycine max]KRH22201.1 hypothetical protein GLYMA_13G284700v4 [Glycine max]|eukprot:XP_006594801.1 uncharacterized protein LOC100779229 [Glycine max]
MGGGGAMRTVAKFATAGIRGVPSVRRASSQTAAASEVSPLQAAAWDDVDDWEVADGGEGTPRVVLGGVPSFQEATSATTELKHAIDKIYLSSNSSECDGCSLSGHVSVMSPSHSELENKSRVTEAILNPSESNRALQAFQLLSECPEAQSVVASIACDPNIWNAIVQNPALQDFFQSQQTADFEVEETHDQRLGNLPYSDSVYAFIDSLNVLQNVKFTVSEMLSRVPNYLQNMFGFLSGQTSSAVIDARGNTKANFIDPITMGGTFMGLAVLVVMVIMLKRA